MAPTPALDLDLVRTLVLIAEEKSFTRAAERIGRTQSAVSLQVQRLVAVVGHTLIARGKGGRVELTAHGEELVGRGRALLALNDDIIRSVHARQAPRPRPARVLGSAHTAQPARYSRSIRRGPADDNCRDRYARRIL